MADGSYDNRVLVFVEDDTPITDAEPGTIAPFEPLYIPVARGREINQSRIDPVARIHR